MKTKTTKPLKSQIFRKLAALYQGMDAAYQGTAAHLGLSCQNCEDNCCRGWTVVVDQDSTERLRDAMADGFADEFEQHLDSLAHLAILARF